MAVLSLQSSRLDPEISNQFVVWNVGQGSSASLILRKECWHFDLGGEVSPTAKIKRQCSNKKQRLFLSHFDRDHVNFVLENSPRLCRMNEPLSAPRPWRTRILRRIPPCEDWLDAQKSSFFYENLEVVRIYRPNTVPRTANEASEVFLIKPYGILISGDSPIQREKIWMKNVGYPVKIFLLGHHGSRTSNSEALLKTLLPTTSVSSSRKKVYGHPHVEVVSKMRQLHRPLLQTESWGNIRFYLAD